MPYKNVCILLMVGSKFMKIAGIEVKTHMNISVLILSRYLVSFSNYQGWKMTYNLAKFICQPNWLVVLNGLKLLLWVPAMESIIFWLLMIEQYDYYNWKSSLSFLNKMQWFICFAQLNSKLLSWHSKQESWQMNISSIIIFHFR
jgi:hypothetical protein